ncbi:phage portal protein, HK97 family [Devosia lucknowensis]|uniref:Phage portal protein, HK97 family n=1 Tax=Devosia lucknowensis TaxID=1096929 RepID=A0A1Y6EH52_9HYPH|nr:phage portal protein [Devosia lucknowensis]SMQ61945.1 phage portal protein, HK97 family [Devosia lucknowensis]
MGLIQEIKKRLSPPSTPSGYSAAGMVVREPFAGAWQRNMELSPDDLLNHPAVFACTSLISNTVAKMAINLHERKDGVWTKVENHPSFSPVLKKPNRFETRQQFISRWVLSLLHHGNTYVIKRRDRRSIVVEMYVLDPRRVRPLISESGEVFYELQVDDLATVHKTITVPASEIIHDRVNCIHPLVGISPLVAAALPVLQSRKIMDNSVSFFANSARPGGVLTAVGSVADSTVEQLRSYWVENYSGHNSGKVAVLADGLTFQAIPQATHGDSQVLEQLGWTSTTVCSIMGVPPHMIGIGEKQSNANVLALDQLFYSTCVGHKVEAIEALLDEGLRLPSFLRTEFDLEAIHRLDPLAQMEWLDRSKGKLTINEQRRVLNLPPIEGGESVYLQHQDYSVAALSRRDNGPDPFGNSAATNDNDTLSSEAVDKYFKTIDKLGKIKDAVRRK